MLTTQSSLLSAQLGRNSLAEVAESPAPLREVALEGLRRRNALLDALFYDVGIVTKEEARQLSPWLAREGSLLIVPPSGKGAVELCASPEDFVQRGGKAIRILSVAGVGSSALGSAAFARNVADALDQPVAAVISGYGLADLLTEAAGGWFWFGGLNQMRHQFETLDAAARRSSTSLEGTSGLSSVSLDTRTVCALLSDQRLSFRLLTGHSKGNLVLSEALYALHDAKRLKGAGTLQLITVSAAIAVPKAIKTHLHVMGGIDWFGAFNSRPQIDVDKSYPMAWHHTNTELPFHLPVTRALADVAAQFKLSV